jgi:hypothetical protein
VFRTEKRRNPQTGPPYPWLVSSTAMVNHYYFYAVDADCGPFFLKFCAYFPYNAKLCLNGHEYVKRQLARRAIADEALDNGLRTCAAPAAWQRLGDGRSATKIEGLLRKWCGRLPHPFGARDRRAGYRYRCSILQAEFSLTHTLDHPVTGRMFFEQVIRENLDLGRPDQGQLIFGRRVSKQTPGPFRTRVITEGVVPSLHVDYKHSRIKQYHKEGQALRTETTINDTRDFDIRKGLSHLSALRKVGCQANRRRLDVQRISHDCAMGEAAFASVGRPVTVTGQRAAGLRFYRSRRPGVAQRVGRISLGGPRLAAARSTRTAGCPARARADGRDRGGDDVPAAPLAAAWPDRAPARHASLPGDDPWPAHRPLLHAGACAALPVWLGGRHAGRRARRPPAASGLRAT